MLFRSPAKLSMSKEKDRQRERSEHLQRQVSELYRILPPGRVEPPVADRRILRRPEENLLYLFEKFSPDLESWQREILRIVRKIATYFYPQSQTKIMNEGFASLTHYEILNRLHEKGLMTDGAKLEFLAGHSSVLRQPSYSDRRYGGINPYALGFAMFRDIQRMCESPTEEDLRWRPVLRGARSRDVILDAVESYRDESFIRQWLSPKVIRDFRLFSVHDDRYDSSKYYVTAIHDERGYEEIRENLAEQTLRASQVPAIEATDIASKTRRLTLVYTPHGGRKLGGIERMMQHVQRLWNNYPVVIKDDQGYMLGSL